MIRIDILLAAAALAAASCAQPLAEPEPDAGARTGQDDQQEEEPSLVTTEEDDAGFFVTTVDATSEERWIDVSLESGTMVDDDSWDLGFQRYHIRLNGGVSGAGDRAVAVLADVAFDELDTAPADGYVTDRADRPDDDDERPDYAMSSGELAWYDYDPQSHTLSPREQIYVLRAGERHVKIQLLSYYDQTGTPAHVQFRWAPIAAPGE